MLSNFYFVLIFQDHNTQPLSLDEPSPMSIPLQEIPNSVATEQRAGPKETTSAENVSARRFVKEPSIEIPNSGPAVKCTGLNETNPAKIVTARRVIKEATSAEKVKDLSNNLQTAVSRSNQKKDTSNKPECWTRERQIETFTMSLRVRQNKPVDKLENHTEDLITRRKRQKRPEGSSRKISAVGGPKNPSDGSSKVESNKNVKIIDKLSKTEKKLSAANVSPKSKNGILLFYGENITLSSLTKLSIFDNTLRI